MEIRSLFMLICIPAICQAQLQVKGKVGIETGGALSYASVLLLNASDSSIVRGNVSQDDGSFSIDVTEEGHYLLSISAVGYHHVFTPSFELKKSNSPFDHGIISAIERTEELNEVVVDRERPMFEQWCLDFRRWLDKLR